MSEPESTSKPEDHAATSAEVYAVHGADPEVQAYAMAKYSRSALSMRESLKELNAQRAEKFLNTFYFQYGHRSIADLAHIALAIERLSILAAIAVVDEQRWDGQERSTRYQDFKRSGYYVPGFRGSDAARGLFRETASQLFADYESISQRVFEFLRETTARPTEMPVEQYERTLRARAFDAARYLLPLATNTSLGQIVNARTLETQVSRLLASRFAEVRRIGELLKEAATRPAFNVNASRYGDLISNARTIDGALASELESELLKPVLAAPTLVKYAEPSAYVAATRDELKKCAADLMQDVEVDAAPTVDLLDDDDLEVDLATTLLYEQSCYGFRQIRDRVRALTAKQREEIIALGTKHRGRHDELLRPFCAGQGFRFDILMDIGAYRDLHRHRRCIQIAQEFTFAHGYQTPDEILAAGIGERYASAMNQPRLAAGQLAGALTEAGIADHGEVAYLIPLGYCNRSLFKMDFAEVVYITELRTGPGGHMSYRRVAHQMYEAVAARYPALAKHFRVTDVREPIDLLKR